MTIMEALNRTDAVKPNGYGQTEKINWLSALDGDIKTKIFDTHEGPSLSFSGYDEQTPLYTELLVPAPYDVVYLYYLSMQIDYANGELSKYNNSALMFNSAYADLERYCNRTLMPKSYSARFSF